MIAILEDDDIWSLARLRVGLTAADSFGFVSSNQTVIDTFGNHLETFDFPTPSGWLMRREVWDLVGGMDESLRWHVDNEWLGRLNLARVPRCHLVDAGFPLDLAMQRPWLANTIAHLPPGSIVRRHDQETPLVIRTLNLDGGMRIIARGGTAAEISQREYQLLEERFGYIPS